MLKYKSRHKSGFCIFRDPAGTRTQGPYIKSVLLYQLSYGISRTVFKRECKNKTKTHCIKFFGKSFLKFPGNNRLIYIQQQQNSLIFVHIFL